MSGQKISNHLSVKITHSNTFFTFLIVLMHYSASFRQYLPDNTIFEYSYFYFAQVLSRLAVPCFFVISGLLAFWKIEKISDFKVLIRKRLFSLAVPYLLWNIIGYIYVSLPLLIKTRFANLSIFNPLSFLASLCKSEFVGPLWYVRNLLLFSCLAPLIYLAFQNKVSTILLFFIAVVIVFIPPDLGLFSGIFFYIFGAFLALYCKDYVNCRHSFSWGIVVCTVIFVGFQIYRIFNYDSRLTYTENRDVLYEFLCPLLFLYLTTSFRSERIKVKNCERHTFIIYASHYLVVSIMASSLFFSLINFPSDSIVYNLIVLISEPIIIYFGLHLLGTALNRYCPTIYKLLSGGR